LTLRNPPTSPLFPYTTLFRSDLFDRPIIGAIPASRVLPKSPDPQALPPGEAEAFRMLRTNLRYFNVDREVNSVLVTSPEPGDGKDRKSTRLNSSHLGISYAVF